MNFVFWLQSMSYDVKIGPHYSLIDMRHLQILVIRLFVDLDDSTLPKIIPILRRATMDKNWLGKFLMSQWVHMTGRRYESWWASISYTS